nr:PREDICTED: probable G-protein coupled receptor 139 isoform X2 [Linepithema humile]
MTDEINLTLNVIDHIEQYYIPIFLCLCLLGNSLSVYVLFFTKLRYNSSSIYLGTFAMSDIAVLMTIFMIWFEWRNIINYENWLRILLFGLRWLFCFLSIWIVVAFTVQRYIAIKWPLLRRSLCTVNRAKTVMIGLVGLAVLYSIPWFILKSKDFNADKNITNLKNWWRIFISVNAIITLILPVTIIVMFNTLIIYIIRKQNRIQKNLILCSAVSDDKTRSTGNETSHIKVTKMLVIISSVFICLNVPIKVCTLCINYGISNMYISIIFPISTFLYVINYGINFVLYCATGTNFRRELILMFTKCSDSRKNEDTEMKNFEKQCD